jgi:hypothetical protein
LSPMEPGSAREADRGSSHVEKSFGGNYLQNPIEFAPKLVKT